MFVFVLQRPGVRKGSVDGADLFSEFTLDPAGQLDTGVSSSWG